MNDMNPTPPMSATSPTSIGPQLRQQHRTDGASAAPGVRPSGASDRAAGTSGVAFRVLIEKLESQANALEKEAARVSGPDDLAGAVDRAHASLQDALTLSDRLLEAYRESLQHGTTVPKPETR